MSFLREGLLAGENVLLVAVDEPPMEIMENVREFGWDLSAVRTMDANPVLRAIRKNMDVQEIKGLQDLKTMREMSSDLHRQQQESDDITIQSIQLKLKQQLSNETLPARRHRLHHLHSMVRDPRRERYSGRADRSPIVVALLERTRRDRPHHLDAVPTQAFSPRKRSSPAGRSFSLASGWETIRSVRSRSFGCVDRPMTPTQSPFTITGDGVLVG